MQLPRPLFLLSLCLLIASPVFSGVDDKRLRAADTDPGSWLSYGRNYAEDRFSTLSQITAENVGKLSLAWYADIPGKDLLQATPLAIDGVLYSSGTWSRVYAHDAKTGKLLWAFDPQVDRRQGVHACCGKVNRGVAAWGDRVFVGTLDGRLIALNAATGAEVWSVQTTDPKQPYSITGAPRVVNGKVVIGNGGAEFGVRGFVTAYAADSGKQVWRFYTVPGDPARPYEAAILKEAAKTWSGDKYWKYGGGGTAWDAMAFDPELNLLYIGVGNGSPWNRHVRSPGGGDNLFLSSIVALDADTGEYAWHYQTTPADTWDYTATQHILLAELTIDGKPRKVLMQAPKNGFYYVLDRASGELISAEKYVTVTWASHVDPKTGRPVETEYGDHADQPVFTRPSHLGGHNWHPMAYNPKAGLVYIPVLEYGRIHSTSTDYEYYPGAATWNLGDDDPRKVALADAASPSEQEPHGKLLAWDPVRQTAAWEVRYDVLYNSGILTTATDLVFHGTEDGRFLAYRASDGEVLWQDYVASKVGASPITFEHNGEQYVAVMASTLPLVGPVTPQPTPGWVPSRLLVYKLGGKAQLPAFPPQPKMAKPVVLPASADELVIGEGLYTRYCFQCHGSNAIGSGRVTDLRYLDEARLKLFDKVVLEGMLENAGMGRFDHVLDKNDTRMLRAWLSQQAQLEWETRQAAGQR